MKGKGLFIFYLVFWVCGRLYIMADSYLLSRIFHSIGLHFDIFCLVYYIYSTAKEKYQKVFWRMFLIYESISIFVYCNTQLSVDHMTSSDMWEQGFKNSAANNVYGNMGFIQDIFIPAFIVLVAFFIHKYALNVESS